MTSHNDTVLPKLVEGLTLVGPHPNVYCVQSLQQPQVSFHLPFLTEDAVVEVVGMKLLIVFSHLAFAKLDKQLAGKFFPFLSFLLRC